MRILFLSSFYPPHEIGGWGQLVEDIAFRLSERGHSVRVLTSRHRVDRRDGRSEWRGAPRTLS